MKRSLELCLENVLTIRRNETLHSSLLTEHHLFSALGEYFDMVMKLMIITYLGKSISDIA